jgi:hypothetical protein
MYYTNKSQLIPKIIEKLGNLGLSVISCVIVEPRVGMMMANICSQNRLPTTDDKLVCGCVYRTFVFIYKQRG